MTTKLQSEFDIAAPSFYSDGVTPLPNPDQLTFSILVDTNNPPTTAYAVPAAQSSGVPGANIVATFAQVGFKPVLNTTYYATVTATGPGGTSAEAPIVKFTYALAPAAPSFTVA